MELVGYLAASVIGLSLGLVGGGGSILTLPVLVYLLKVEPLLATSYSLFIVGVTSSIGAFIKSKQSVLSLGSIIAFGIPSMLMVILTRQFLVPSIPAEITLFTDIILPKSTFILLLFSVLMIMVALNMIYPQKQTQSPPTTRTPSLKRNYFLLVIAGILEGTLSGIVGAGGGFLIIPALVMLAQVPMKQAIATSLFIVGSKSLIGFVGDLSHLLIDWSLLLTVALITLFGFVVGHLYSKKLSSEKLRLLFGYFVLAMGVVVFTKELFI